MPIPSKDLHDRCLRVAIDHKAKLSAADYDVLNTVASAWAACLTINRSIITKARIIVERIASPGH